MAERATSTAEAPAGQTSGARVDARSERFWLGITAGICLAYVVVQLVYIGHIPVSMDEFQGAHEAYRLKGSLPYVDYKPYKNVLGYYLQLPFVLIGDDAWSHLMWVKRGMACASALVLLWVARLLSRSIDRGAVALALAATVSMSTLLERASEVRVDGLTGLAGLVALAWLLQGRMVAAGLAAGGSFLISQKGAYFCVAAAVALGTHWWIFERTRARAREIVKLGLAAFAVIAVYLLVFSIASSSAAGVAKGAIGTAASVAVAEPYTTLWRYWQHTLTRNPYFYGASLLGIGAALAYGHQQRSTRDWLVFGYAGTVFALCVWHRQPWPYFFVLFIPTLWVPMAVLFERLGRHTLIFWLCFAGLGLVLPLSRIARVLDLHNEYQRQNVIVAEQLLGPGETYLAGLHMVFTREHMGGPFGWLDKTKLEQLRGARANEAATRLRDAPPKIVFWNYRVKALPQNIRMWLRKHYEHLWATLWIYSPSITSTSFRLAYAGPYEVVSSKPTGIDGRDVKPREHVQLTAGVHQAKREGFRLRPVIPQEVRKRMPRRFEKAADLYPMVYEY